MKAKKTDKFTDNRVYSRVLELVKIGITIIEACKAIGVDRTWFYRKITVEQKKELSYFKSATKIHGRDWAFGNGDFMTLYSDEENED